MAQSPAEAARESEVVFSMLSDDGAVSSVALGNDGIAAGLPPGGAHISSSTISVDLARKLAQEHQQLGQEFLSAPVLGRPDAAEARKLVIMAAGTASCIDRFTPLFEAVGRRTFVAGPEPWNANAFKLCANFMISSAIESFSEAFSTLRKAELDHHRFLEVIIELFGSPVYQNYGKTLADRKFEPAGFALKLGLKDIRQVLEFAQELPAPMPLASLLRDHLSAAVANGLGDVDWTGIEQIVARNAGLPT